jgi:hypothetical protein
MTFKRRKASRKKGASALQRGLPTIVITDNAREFRATSVASMLRQMKKRARDERKP